MGFRSNEELEKRTVGSRWKLTAPLRVAKGEFSAGSIMRITGEADDRGEFPFRDEDSGETVSFNIGMVSCEPYIDSADDIRLASRDDR
jgi:hypothetical protein